MPQRNVLRRAPDLHYRHFPSLPWHLREEFLTHVRTTSQPETFPGLHPGPLDKDEPFQIVAPFVIKATNRPEGDRAPCPMCHHPNKYLHGRLVYLPRLEALAAIGCECADKVTAKAAADEYRALRDQQQGEEYLLSHLHLVHSQLRVLTRALPLAQELRRMCRIIQNKGSGIRAQLAQVNRNGGRLVLVEQLSEDTAATGPRGFGGAGSRDTRDVDIGLLAGSTALIRDYDPVGELKKIEVRIAPFALSRSPEETLQLLVTVEPKEVAVMWVQLREAAQAYSRFQDRIADAVAFFEQDNLQRLAAWASHRLQPHQFIVEVVVERGLRVLRMRGLGADVRVVIDPLIWQRPPDWAKPPV